MKKLILLSIALFLTVSTNTFSKTQPVDMASNKSQFFIKNMGQWDSQAEYLVRLNGLNYWLTKKGIVLDYYKVQKDSREFLENGDPNMENGHITKLWGHAIHSNIIGLNEQAQYIANDKKETYYNYFLGNDESKWASNVPLFSNITLKNAYKGIDVQYYFDEELVRFDFIISPGSDPNQITLQFNGQNSYRINSSGNIEFTTSVGEVEINRLFAYQENETNVKKQVECKFKDIGNGFVKFDIGNYDKNLELIIDPLVWASYIGGSSTDYAYSVGADYSSNGLICGYTSSSNFPTTPGAYDNTWNSTDGYIAKFSSNGSTLLFASFLGGTSSDYMYGCSADQNGYIYVGGYTSSSNYPTTSGCFDNTYNSTDAVATKLNPAGSALSYSTYIGGTSTEISYAMTVSPDGYMYMTGYTSSSNFPTTSGCWDNINNSTDVFVVKINQTGSALSYGTYLGGTSSDYGYGIFVDPFGSCLVTGYTSSSNYPTTSGCYDNTYNSTDIFVTKFNTTGSSLVFSTYLGGTSSDYGYGITSDQNGYVYVTGYTNSSNYPLTSGVVRTVYQGNEAIITKFSPSGGLVYSTFVGGNNSDYGRGIAVDSDGNAIISGYLYSTDLPCTVGAVSCNITGSTPDVFVVKLNSNASTYLYSSYIGGSNYDYGYYYNNVESDHNNGVYISIYSSSTNFPVTSGAYKTNNSGSYDAVLARFSFEPPITITTTTVNPTQMCKGDFFQVSYTIDKGAAKPGNIFSVQISDVNGNFTGTPRIIGQIQAVDEVLINCQLPEFDLEPSSNYKVRVISSNPAAMGTPSSTNITVFPPPMSFNVIGANGYCANAKEGSFIGLDDSEKYTYYQLYHEGTKVGGLIPGTDQPIYFGKFKPIGIYTVEAISPFGCKSWMSGESDVVIIPMPVTYNMTGGGEYYNQPGPGTYCEGGEGVAIGLSHGDVGINYQIKLNGKDVSVPILGRGDEISFGYFTEEGTYTIEAISVKGDCIEQMNGTMTVIMLPAPKVFNVLSTGTYCEGSQGNEIKLSGSEIGFTYTVFFNGVAISNTFTGTGNEISLGYFHEEGVYTVLATNTTSGCTIYMDGQISLAPVTSPTVFNITGSGKFCQGSDGAVIAIDNSQTEVLYELYNNNIATGYTMVGTGSEITFPPVSENGNYTVVGTTINGSCSIDMNGSVEVSQVALPNVNITGNFAPDMQTSETYSIDSPVEGDSYLWKVINGNIEGSNSGTEITVTWADEKTGTVEVYRTNEFGCANSAVKNVNLANQLDADFVVKPGEGDVPFLVEFENASSGFISSYYWEFGDGTTSPQENPTHTYKQVGTYTVSLTVSHETDKDKETKSDIVKVYPANSVEEDGQAMNSNGTAGISLIEPNPAKTEIRFDYFLTYAQNIDLAIYDVLGNKVMSIVSGLAVEGSNTMKIDISKLGSGNYYLQLTTTDGNVTKHFNVVK